MLLLGNLGVLDRSSFLQIAFRFLDLLLQVLQLGLAQLKLSIHSSSPRYKFGDALLLISEGRTVDQSDFAIRNADRVMGRSSRRG